MSLSCLSQTRLPTLGRHAPGKPTAYPKRQPNSPLAARTEPVFESEKDWSYARHLKEGCILTVPLAMSSLIAAAGAAPYFTSGPWAHLGPALAVGTGATFLGFLSAELPNAVVVHGAKPKFLLHSLAGAALGVTLGLIFNGTIMPVVAGAASGFGLGVFALTAAEGAFSDRPKDHSQNGQ